MKKIIITLIIVALLVGGVIWWNNSKKTENAQQGEKNTTNYQAEKNTTNNQTEKNTTNYQAENSTTNNQTEKNTTNYQAEKSGTNTIVVAKKETEIAKFSTKIYNKDKERQNNIGITCKSLSTKEVQPGEVFSFCNTVGKATHAKGYEEADIYVDGKKEQGLGGGNCQVSTTLYNAVLQVPELEVVERHQHSGHVPYIQEGKDAAVAYGTYDFKFKNNTNNIIKIVMENTTENITAKLIKIEGK